MAETWLVEAKEKLVYLRSIYAKRNASFEQRDAIIDLDHDEAFGWDAPVSEDDLRIMTALPNKLVRFLTGRFLNNPIRLQAFPVRDSESARAKGGKAERFLLGVLQLCEGRFGPIRHAGISGGGVRGWGTWRVRWNPDLGGGDQYDETWDPTAVAVEWEAVDASCLFPEPNGRRERWQSVMYAIWRQRLEVKREWGIDIESETGDGEADEHASGSDLVECVDYWWWQVDETEKGKRKWCVYNAIWADDTVIKPPTEMPMYRRIPYIVWPCQPGHMPNVDHIGQGWVHAIRHAIANWDRAATRAMRRLTFAGDNMYLLEANSMEADLLPEKFELVIESGAVKSVPRGWTVRPLPPSTTPEAQIMLALFGQELDQVGMANSMMGALPEGSSDLSGVAFHQIEDAGMAWTAGDVDTLATAFEQMFDIIIGLCAWHAGDRNLSVLVRRNVRGTQVAEMVSVKGSDLEDFLYVVKLSTKSAADKMRDTQLAMSMAGSPPEGRLMSMRQIREQLLEDPDPSQTEQEILVETALQHPAAREHLMREALRQAGFPQIETLEAEARARQMAQQPAQQQGGPPLMPPQQPGMPLLPGQQGMPPGMGPQQLPPNTMVSPQEMGGSPPPMGTPPPMGPGVF